MAHQDGHIQLGSKPSTSAQPVHSLADLVFDPANFSRILASADSAASAPQEDTSPPSAAGDMPKPTPLSESVEGHNRRTSWADLVLNNVTYDAILASSARGLRLNTGTGESLPEDVRAPPNSPVRGDVEYGSLLGASIAIMEGGSK